MAFYDGKVAIVTGGSRGLGLIIARQICEQRGKVALIARDPNELDRAKAELTQRGGEVLTVECDLTDRAQIQPAVARIIQRFGKIDILINNAGIIEVGPLQHMQREDFERSLQLHLWAPFELIQQVLPVMRVQGEGRIVNIASIGGKVAVPHMAPYSTSKFALVGLSDALRNELARENIFVTTVTPGLIRTGSEGHATFKGNRAAEFKSFASASKVPFASISAERAAQKILKACAGKKPALVMPFSASLAILANAKFPNLTGWVMQFINSRLSLPVGKGGDEARPGSDVR